MRNLSLFLIALSFIQDVSANFSNSMSALIDNGQIKVQPGELVVRRNISGASSTFKLLKASDDKIDGVSDFTGDKLPQNEGFIISKVAVGITVAAASTPGLEATSNYQDAFTGIIRNSTLSIKQKGRRVLILPFAIFDFSKSNATSSKDLYFELGSLAYIVDTTPIDLELIVPQGQSVPATTTATTYMEVRLNGFNVDRKTEQ